MQYMTNNQRKWKLQINTVCSNLGFKALTACRTSIAIRVIEMLIYFIVYRIFHFSHLCDAPKLRFQRVGCRIRSSSFIKRSLHTGTRVSVHVCCHSQLILFFFDSLTVCVKAGAHPVFLCLLLIKHSFDCEPK